METHHALPDRTAGLFKTPKIVSVILPVVGEAIRMASEDRTGPPDQDKGRMFAVDHAATALILKRRYPTVPLVPVLVSVQAMELAWVALSYAGVERTVVDQQVRSVANIHLAYMPFSHSVATPVAAALGAFWLIARGFNRPDIGRAVGLGIVSHLVLDLLTHARDIALAPGVAIMFGSGLYARTPLVAFAIELGFGALCWWVYVRGRMRQTAWRGLLAFVVIGNVLNLSFLSPAIDGPETLLAGRPGLVVTVVLLQIVVTLALVYAIARRDRC
jgi:hypothetical protein